MTYKTQKEIELILQHFKDQTIPDGGLAFADEILLLAPNTIDVNLKKINDLITGLHTQGMTSNFVLQQHGGLNFLMMIASYLYDVINQRTQTTTKWYNYHEILNLLPQNYDLPFQFSSSLIAIIQQQIYLPFLIIDELLHGNTEKNISTYVQEQCDAIEHLKHENLNDRCQRYLSILKNKGYLGVDYRIQQSLTFIDFDDTYTSIAEIDCLLETIKEQDQLDDKTYPLFIQNEQNQILLISLGFYLGNVIAKHALSPLKWCQFEEYQQHLYTHSTTFDCVFVMDGKPSYPIAIILECLFKSTQRQTCLDYVKQFVRTSSSPLHYFSSAISKHHQQPVPPIIATAFEQAGFLAAYATFKLKNDQTLLPILLIPTADNQTQLIHCNEHDLNENIQQKLEGNDHQHTYQIYSENTDAYLPTGRTSAIHLKLFIYQPFILSVHLVIPYDLADKGHKFKLHSVIKYNATELTRNELDAAIAIFYTAAFQFIDPISNNKLWVQHFEEQIFKRPSHENAKLDILYALKENFIFFLKDHGPTPSTIFIEKKSPKKPTSASKIDEVLSHKNPHLEVSSDISPAIHHIINNLDHIKIQQEINNLPAKYHPYLQVMPPSWLNTEHALYQQIRAMPTLYNRGHVVWGALIQADAKMFEPEDQHSTGEIIFDPDGNTPVEELIQYAKILYALNDTTPEQEDQRNYVELIKNKQSCLINYPFPKSLANVNLRISKVWFWRYHLANGMLSLEHFPILTCIDTSFSGQSMVLPSWFWPKTFREQWLKTTELKYGQNYDLNPNIFKNLENFHTLVPESNPSQLKPDLAVLQYNNHAELIASAFPLPTTPKRNYTIMKIKIFTITICILGLMIFFNLK